MTSFYGQSYTSQPYRLVHWDQHQARASFQVRAEYPDFRGHFDDFPILPGVSQMTMVQDLLEKLLGFRIRLLELQRVKFLAMLLPGVEIAIQVTKDPVAVEKAHWQITAGDKVFSKGTVLYAAKS